MQKSESIANLAAALSKAQGQIETAKKTSANPYFKSKYADLSEVWDACRVALGANGLAVVQFPVSSEEGIGVETILMHSSGEWMSEKFFLPISASKEGSLTAQGGGSCVTYARRYALAAVVGVCPEDDDGNAASKSPRAPLTASVNGSPGYLTGLKAAAKNGMDALEAAWKLLDSQARKDCQPHLAQLKKEAANATATA